MMVMRFGDQWASLLVAIPLFGAFVIPLLWVLIKRRWVAPLVGILTTGLGLAVALDVLRVVLGGKVIEVIMGGYVPPIGINWRIDAWGGVLAVLVYLIAFAAAIYSVGYVHREKWVQFYAIMMVMVAGAVGVAVTGDLFNLFVFLEVASIAAYILVSTDADATTLEASFKYLVLGSLATSFVLLGIALLYGAYHTLNIYDIAGKIGKYPVLDLTAIALLLVGLGVEGALFPLGSWLPDAHPSAPSPISAMLSGTLIKIGLVGIVRVLMMIRSTPYLGRVLGIMLVWGILTAFWGELSALRQRDIKRLLAHSSIAQMGYIFAALSAFTPLGIAAALMHMIVHALSKGVLFLSAGAFIEDKGTREIEALRGSGREWAGFSFGVGALALMGLPPTPGFFSKFLILLAIYQRWGALPVVLIFMAAAVEVFYYLRLVGVLFDRGEGAKANLWMALPTLTVSVLTIVLGFMPAFLIWMAAGKGALTGVLPYGSLLPQSMVMPVLLLVLAAALCIVPRMRIVGVLGGLAVLGWMLGDMLSAGLTVFGIVAVLSALAVFGILISHLEGDGRADGLKDALLVLAFGFLLMTLRANGFFAFLYYWELMSIAAFFLFMTEPERTGAGIVYTTIMTVLSYVMMLGIVSGYFGSGGYAFASVLGAAATLVAVAMAFKLGAFPLHVWAEYGYEAAHPVVAGYLSGAVSKVAMLVLMLAVAYGAISPRVHTLLIWAGAIGIVWAGYRAVRSRSLLGILAFSSISQMSYVLVGLLIGGAAAAGAWLHALGHAVFETGLFLVAYVVLMMYGTTDLYELRKGGGVHPVLLYLSGVLVLSLAGVPPLSGFASKWLMYLGAINSHMYIVAILMMVGSALSMVYGLRFMAAIGGETKGARGVITALPLAVYAAITAGFGIYPQGFFKILYPALKPMGVVLPLTWKELIFGIWGGSYYDVGLVVVLFALSLVLFAIIWWLMPDAQLKGKVFRGGVFYEPTEENLPTVADMLWPISWLGAPLGIVDRWHEAVAQLTATLADWMRGVYTGYLPDYALYVSLALAVIMQFAHM